MCGESSTDCDCEDSQGGGGLKLWDETLDRGWKVYSILGHHGRGRHPCPSCLLDLDGACLWTHTRDMHLGGDGVILDRIIAGDMAIIMESDF